MDRNPWGQASEETDPFAKGPDRGSVAVWVVNLTPSASYDLLDFKDTDADGLPLPQRTGVDFDTDCRWIPSTTALAVDTLGGLRRAQKVNGIRQPPPPTKRPPRPSRAFRGGRSGYDQAMQSYGTKAPTYRTEGRVYALAPALGPTAKWGVMSNKGKRGCGNICPSGGATSSSKDDYEPSPIDAALEPPLRREPTAPVHLARRVILPHLAVPPLAIHRWHVRMDSTPPPPMVPTSAVIAALTAEHQTAKLFASTTPASPAPTVVDILREAGRRARSRGAAQVTPLDVRHAAQLFAPPRASLAPLKPFVDPLPEHADELPGLFDTVRAAVEASGHRPPRGLSVGDATGIVANAFRRAGCDMVTIDRLPSEDPTMPHIIGDASDFLDAGFDFVVGQPKVSIDESGILSPERRARALDLVARHHAAFSTDAKVPGTTHLLEVSVDLKPGSLPFRHAPSRTGTAGEKIIEEAVNDMEANGIIRKSTSQWASRVVLVSKKSSPDPRFCVDLRDLNSRLVVLDTPLPRCDDAIDRLGVASERRPETAGQRDTRHSGHSTASPEDASRSPLAGTTGTDAIDSAPRALKMLSKNLLYHTLDLTAGFWNLPVKESHRERLAFVTSKGKWEFNVLPFGLMTGPSYMQRMIEATLVGLNWELCLPYLDDVIIWANGDTEEEAFEQSMERLELVLERLEWAGLRAKPSKCHLFATSVDYLGHVCSRDGVSLDPKKISAVSSINPRSINNLETVRSFLGLAGYYRNHIENFHVLSSPLVDLTKAGVDVPTESQKPEAQAAVANLIKALCSDPVLMYPRSDREFIVATDAATGVGVGACLKQVDDDGTERVVSYHGRRFNKAERNYTVTECDRTTALSQYPSVLGPPPKQHPPLWNPSGKPRPPPSLVAALSRHPLVMAATNGTAEVPEPPASLVAALSQHPLVTAALDETAPPPPPMLPVAPHGGVQGPPSSLRLALSQHPLVAPPLGCPTSQLIAALAQHPMLAFEARPSPSLALRSGVHLPRSAKRATTPRRRVNTPSKTVVAQRGPLPPRPGRELARTPDVYVSASGLNRNWTAKQRGRRGHREPIVDAGWGLFLARDMKRDDVVLDYRFIDGREGTEVDRLNADQLAERYPDPLFPATHVLRVWNSSSYWDTLRCKGIGGFANSRVGYQNCLFRGTKIRIGKTGCKENTEVFLSYSSSNSYRWASDLQLGEDFYTKGTAQPQRRVRVRRPPWTTVPWSAAATMDFHARRPPWSTTPWSATASLAGSEPDLTFDEEDISGNGDEANPLAYCAYLKNVRIAQVWEDGKKRRYRLNSACCWMRSTIADPGAGPSVIGQRLLHALPPDAVVRHVPMAPRMGPVVGPGGERLLMLGTVTVVPQFVNEVGLEAADGQVFINVAAFRDIEVFNGENPREHRLSESFHCVVNPDLRHSYSRPSADAILTHERVAVIARLRGRAVGAGDSVQAACGVEEAAFQGCGGGGRALLRAVVRRLGATAGTASTTKTSLLDRSDPGQDLLEGYFAAGVGPLFDGGDACHDVLEGSGVDSVHALLSCVSCYSRPRRS